MKTLITIATLLFCTNPAWADFQSGNEHGNGGGGIQRDGQYLTFGSAHVLLLPTDSVDYLDDLIETCRSLRLADKYRTPLTRALRMSAQRRYYFADKISPEEEAQLKKTYGKLIGNTVAPEELVIYAVTDAKAGETYLLPQFKKLDAIQQMAILFHEGLWVYDHQTRSQLVAPLTYEKVLEAEVRFQEFLEKGIPHNQYDRNLYQALNKVLRNEWVSLHAALLDDQEAHRLDPYLNDQGELLLSAVLGPSALESYLKALKKPAGSGEVLWYPLDQNRIFEYLFDQVNRSPEVVSFNELLDRLPKMRLELYKNPASTKPDTEGQCIVNHFNEISEEDRLGIIQGLAFRPWDLSHYPTVSYAHDFGSGEVQCLDNLYFVY